MNSSKFEQESLAAHNKWRAKHGTPALVLNHDLCIHAREWAQHLIKTNEFSHRPNNRYGENLYMTSSPTLKGSIAVDAWYKEIKDYDFRKPGFSMKTGHFTAVVWKQSRALGIAMAKRSDGMTVVVANYDPPGNMLGAFPENVPRPL